MYQTTGEHRAPRFAEPYLYQWQGQWVICHNTLGIISEPKIILEKIQHRFDFANFVGSFCERYCMAVGSISIRFMY